jgi:DNA-binding MarR family transcriptional regulator
MQFLLQVGFPMSADTAKLRTPGFLVRRMQQISVSIFHETLRELDITPVQQTILRIIAQEPGLDQLSIASRAMLDTSTVKDVLTRLASKEIVKRERSEHDGRMRLTYLTSLGQKVLAKAEPLSRRASVQFLAPLTPAERQLLLSMMDRIVAAHESENDIAQPRTPFKRLKSV